MNLAVPPRFFFFLFAGFSLAYQARPHLYGSVFCSISVKMMVEFLPMAFSLSATSQEHTYVCDCLANIVP